MTLTDFMFFGAGVAMAWVMRSAISAFVSSPHATSGRVVKVDYTNWRGDRRTRPIDPVALVFKKSGWHEKPQWFVEAFDVGADKHYDEPKDFALANIHQWIDPEAADSK